MKATQKKIDQIDSIEGVNKWVCVELVVVVNEEAN